MKCWSFENLITTLFLTNMHCMNIFKGKKIWSCHEQELLTMQKKKTNNLRKVCGIFYGCESIHGNRFHTTVHFTFKQNVNITRSTGFRDAASFTLCCLCNLRQLKTTGWMLSERNIWRLIFFSPERIAKSGFRFSRCLWSKVFSPVPNVDFNGLATDKIMKLIAVWCRWVNKSTQPPSLDSPCATQFKH